MDDAYYTENKIALYVGDMVPYDIYDVARRVDNRMPQPSVNREWLLEYDNVQFIYFTIFSQQEPITITYSEIHPNRNGGIELFPDDILTAMEDK